MLVSMASPSSGSGPSDVFYVVQSTGLSGDREHRICSALYQSRPQAETELLRLKRTNTTRSYAIWKSSTYVEPAHWDFPVVMTDGSVVQPQDGKASSDSER